MYDHILATAFFDEDPRSVCRCRLQHVEALGDDYCAEAAQRTEVAGDVVQPLAIDVVQPFRAAIGASDQQSNSWHRSQHRWATQVA